MNLCQFWDRLEPMNKIMMRALISWLWSCCIWRLTDKNQCYNLTSSNFSNEKNWFILVFGMRYGYVHLHYCFFLENKNIHWWHLCCRNVISVACTLLAGTLSFCLPNQVSAHSIQLVSLILHARVEKNVRWQQ